MTNIYHLPVGGAKVGNAGEGSPYMQEIAVQTVRKLGELGLHATFHQLVGAHIERSEIVFDPKARESNVSVEKINFGKQSAVWQRRARVSVGRLGTLQSVLSSTVSQYPSVREAATREAAEVVSFNNTDLEDNRTELFLRSVALDWALFELGADAMHEGVNMQQRFGRYVRDYTMDVSNPFEHRRLRAGLALQLMHDHFIRRGVVDTQDEATQLVDAFTSTYPMAIEPGSIYSGENVKPVSEKELGRIVECYEPKEWPSEGSGIATVVELDGMRGITS